MMFLRIAFPVLFLLSLGLFVWYVFSLRRGTAPNHLEPQPLQAETAPQAERRAIGALWISSFLVVAFAAAALLAWVGPGPPHPPPMDVSRYGFESGEMGWVHETNLHTQGLTAASRSPDRWRFGRYSLKLVADLKGGHESRSKGEVHVEAPLQDLEGKPVTAWVYVPADAIGEEAKPAGIQIFVKDRDWRAQYGTWWNITPARVDGWHRLTLMPSRSAPPDGHMDQRFDPTQIRAVGLKVAMGEASERSYKGPIYMDAVDWP